MSGMEQLERLLYDKVPFDVTGGASSYAIPSTSSLKGKLRATSELPFDAEFNGGASSSATLPMSSLERDLRVTNEHSSQNVESHSQHERSKISMDVSWEYIPVLPTIALVVQLIILIAMVSFLILTSTGDHPVPSLMAEMYLRYPQSTFTVLTLFGSLLSLINTKCFAEAVRFAINVSLTNGGLSLYSLHAATSVASKSLLFGLDRGRLRWAIISVIYFALFTAQTSAWTTIITPRSMLIQKLGSFQDMDWSAPELTDNVLDDYTDVLIWDSSLRAFESGIAAVQKVHKNITQLLPYSNSIFNGTSRGILPIPNLVYNLGNWTRIEVAQQGFTADVTCKPTDPSDKAFSINQVTRNIRNITYKETQLLCNGTRDPLEPMTTNLLLSGDDVFQSGYLFYVACPWSDTDTPGHIITLYTSFLGLSTVNITCSIKPQLLNVNVTYENNGIVTVESMARIPVDLPTNSSAAVLVTMIGLETNLFFAQGLIGIMNIGPPDDPDSMGALAAPLPLSIISQPEHLAAYIQGVIEGSGTASRQASPMNLPSTQTVSMIIYVQAIVWGQDPQLKLIIIVAPMAVTITTILVLLFSLYRARKLCMKHTICFDPMDTLHVITASRCSSGNVQTIPFLDYNRDISTFWKDVEVQLPKGRGRDNEGGFQFRRRI